MTYKPKIQSKIYTNSLKNHIHLYENMDNSCKSSLKLLTFNKNTYKFNKMTDIHMKTGTSHAKLHENHQKLQQNL